MADNKKLHRCCFTGHRPQKINLSEEEIKILLEKAIDNAIANGYVTFITGMASGSDIWAAEIVLERKKSNNNLHLICAVPYYGFEKNRTITLHLTSTGAATPGHRKSSPLPAARTS